MQQPPITEFRPDPELLKPLLPCTGTDLGFEPGAEWPCNILSRRTVVYGDGRVAKSGEPVSHRVDPDELDLCRRLAAEAAEAAEAAGDNYDFAMDSEQAGLGFSPFFVAADAGDAVPGRIDADLIRSRFGGTIFPPARVTVAPLAEQGQWWEDIDRGRGGRGADFRDEQGDDPPEDQIEEEWREDYDQQRSLAEENLRRMRQFMRWFNENPHFKDAAYVAIGDNRAGGLRAVPREDYPPGTSAVGAALPRLILGLTRSGSLAGVFGYVVQT